MMKLENVLMGTPDFTTCKEMPKPEYVYVATDIGSTMQRTLLFDLENSERQSEVIKLGTPYCQVALDSDFSTCPGASNSVLDNLDLTITCDNPTKNTSIKSSRVVKGSLLSRLNLSERVLTSDTSKVDSASMYVNILCNIALVLLAKAAVLQEDPSFCRVVDVTISLPPDDANIPERVRQFKSRLVGRYTVTFNRLNTAVRFLLDGDNIYTASEPLGAALYRIMADDEIDTEMNCGFLDCGGRSSGTIFFADETLKEGSSYAFPIGGVSLLDTLADRIASDRCIQRPRQSTLFKVLETGIYKYGGERIDVSESITQAKRVIAEELYNGLSRGLSLNKLQATDLERIYCSGRTFGETRGKDGEVISPSICVLLSQLFAEKSPSTKFIHECDEAAVAKGLIYARARYGVKAFPTYLTQA